MYLYLLCNEMNSKSVIRKIPAPDRNWIHNIQIGTCGGKFIIAHPELTMSQVV